MKPTLAQALQQAIAAHKEGKLQEAERLYRAILQKKPNNPDANHNLGVLVVSAGKPLEALPFLKQALDTNPEVEQFWLSHIDALVKSGHFDEAQRLIEDSKKNGVAIEKLKVLSERVQKTSLKIEPPQTQLDALLDHYQNCRFDDAEALAKSLTEEFPAHQFGWKVLGAVFKNTNRVGESLGPLQKSVKLSPGDAEAQNNLGNTFQALGRLEEAEGSYKRAVELRHDFPQAHYNLGNALREQSKFEQAEASYKRAIDLKPDLAEAHNNLGLTLRISGNLTNAESSYLRAIQLQPENASAHNALGMLRKDLSRSEEAMNSFSAAISLDPDFVDAHSNLGGALVDLGRFEEAEECFRRAAELNPGIPDVYLNLLAVLDRTNKVDAMSSLLESLSGKRFRYDNDFLLYDSLIRYREGHYAEAKLHLDKISENGVSEERKLLLYKILGDLSDRTGEYEAAFDAFTKMNALAKNGQGYLKKASGAEQYFKVQQQKLAQLRKPDLTPLGEKCALPEDHQPIFLIGFPRSGTTLLDAILRSHSKLDVIEEKPMVQKMIRFLGDLRTVAEIDGVRPEVARLAEEGYYTELRKYLSPIQGRLVIDKLPLNLLEVPVINRVFPGAKFILAIRHPLDCILSCWMQDFRLNSATANMLDLSRIVDFYCASMEIFKLSCHRYKLNVHKIRYEDLVADFDSEVASLLTFLKLSWEDRLHDYHSTAKARHVINTPSYSQVIKPIYQSAAFRWKHYEKHLEPYKKQLSPWLQEYGY
ncbi:MAG: hypothetical protein CMP34_00120 [Rickettsiales bacterium]|nr:hypothetical protein [Rickettsiales bacterium]